MLEIFKNHKLLPENLRNRFAYISFDGNTEAQINYKLNELGNVGFVVSAIHENGLLLTKALEPKEDGQPDNDFTFPGIAPGTDTVQ